MGKVNPVSAKYVIHARLEAEGTVERPDVIGAIFGQTEGFLGTELELRELQKSGKVGRIDVRLDIHEGKTSGLVTIPCSLDQTEVAVIAAALETIERVGPCNAKIIIEKLEDVRSTKRGMVIERAKELLKRFQTDVLPDSQELTDEVSQSVRAMDLVEWGSDRLPAGPDIEKNQEIILVEGRADVLNLLKYGINNVVAINGTSVPDSIKRLCKDKITIAFVDGDRGGDLIVRELMASTKINYVAKAPHGKEVEELAKKDIHLALRAKIDASSFRAESNGYRKPTSSLRYESRGRYHTQSRLRSRSDYPERRYTRTQSAPRMTKKLQSLFKGMIDDLVGTKGAYLLDKNFTILGKIPVTELSNILRELNNVHAVIFDGIIEQDMLYIAEKTGIDYIVGMKSRLKPVETKVRIITQLDL